MGACSSCLGQRGRDSYDEDEENRLLYDDANGAQYGSFGEPALSGDDTVEAQRESEALQRVVAKTSNNMVDIFEINPAETSTRTSANAFAYAGQGARVARYQHLISKLDSEDNLTSTAGIKVDWMEDDDAADTTGGNETSVSRPQNDEGPLVGTFADAAAAMR
ncbi:late endosomal/lysosomal adaptor and MAPK and MTOR activator domain-containing protein [Sarocladium implicatum]|nr:late endosomal/lysosomal adaptor and MAPK and MTOR activator domain-containing protein [Sarocladium implicatum]